MATGKSTSSTGRINARATQVGGELAETLVLLGETLLAAQQTIAIRLTRLSGVLLNPAAITDPEFTRMGSEKAQAFAEAGFATTKGLLILQEAWWRWGVIQAEAAQTATLSALLAPDPAALARIQVRFVDRSLSAAETAAGHISLAAGRLAGLGLHPIHRTASANARRLGRTA